MQDQGFGRFGKSNSETDVRVLYGQKLPRTVIGNHYGSLEMLFTLFSQADNIVSHMMVFKVHDNPNTYSPSNHSKYLKHLKHLKHSKRKAKTPQCTPIPNIAKEKRKKRKKQSKKKKEIVTNQWAMSAIFSPVQGG